MTAIHHKRPAMRKGCLSCYIFFIPVYLLLEQTGGHVMMMSSNGNIFRVTGLCAGNSPVTGEFPAQRPVTRSFHAFFDLRLNKRLSKQPWGWWVERPARPLWRHCNVVDVIWKAFFFDENVMTLAQFLLNTNSVRPLECKDMSALV